MGGIIDDDDYSLASAMQNPVGAGNHVALAACPWCNSPMRVVGEHCHWSECTNILCMAEGPAADDEAGAILACNTRTESGVIGEMRKAADKARRFIESEYRDPSAEPNGEWLAKEARPIHADLCAILAKLDEERGS